MPLLTDIVNYTAVIFEVAGVLIIVVSFGVSMVTGFRGWMQHGAAGSYSAIRSVFGRGILLGIEVLVAGDIIHTVALQPTMENLRVLGLLVLIRTFLAWSMEVEIEGRWPWTRAADERDRLGD